MKRALLIGGIAVVLGAAAFASGLVPNPFPAPVEVVESGSPEAVAAGEKISPAPTPPDPFDHPIDIVESGTPKARELGEMLPLDPIPDPFGAMDEAARRDARLARERRFREGSGFAPNPVEDAGVFRFDLRLVQFVDSRRAKGKFTQYVNTGDGSIALLNPDPTILSLGGLPMPDTAVHFVLLRPGGTWLVCGRHKEIGKACARTGGQQSVAAGQLRLLHAMHDWQASVARTTQHQPPTTPSTQPAADAQMRRGKFPDGQALTLWALPHASTVKTHLPWLGFGAGLYKDYAAKQNRVAQVVAAEGADLGGGTVLFKLLEAKADTQSFDTRDYRLVTAFSAKGLSEATALGLQLMGEIPRKMADVERALANCPKGRDGKACREQYRAERRALNNAAHDEIKAWAEQHGLPVPNRP